MIRPFKFFILQLRQRLIYTKLVIVMIFVSHNLLIGRSNILQCLLTPFHYITIIMMMPPQQVVIACFHILKFNIPFVTLSFHEQYENFQRFVTRQDSKIHGGIKLPPIININRDPLTRFIFKLLV